MQVNENYDSKKENIKLLVKCFFLKERETSTNPCLYLVAQGEVEICLQIQRRDEVPCCVKILRVTL